MKIATGKSALFVNITTALVDIVNSEKPIYDSGNWTFKTGMVTSIMNYVDHKNIDYVFLYCNQPSFKFKAQNKYRWNILVSQIGAEVSLMMHSQPTQRTLPLVISFSAPSKSGWQMPGDTYFEYCTTQYKLDKTRCTLIGDSQMDQQCASNNKIPAYYDQEIFTNLNLMGKFS